MCQRPTPLFMGFRTWPSTADQRRLLKSVEPCHPPALKLSNQTMTSTSQDTKLSPHSPSSDLLSGFRRWATSLGLWQTAWEPVFKHTFVPYVGSAEAFRRWFQLRAREQGEAAVQSPDLPLCFARFLSELATLGQPPELSGLQRDQGAREEEEADAQSPAGSGHQAVRSQRPLTRSASSAARERSRPGADVTAHSFQAPSSHAYGRLQDDQPGFVAFRDN